MIIVETILREIFTQLPDYVVDGQGSYPINYSWGSEADLRLFLTKKKDNKYPLVWLVQGKQTDYRHDHFTERRLRLILAKNSIHQTSQNPIIFDSEFVACLNPLLDNVLKALEKSGVTTIIGNGQMDVDRRANFTDEAETENYTIDIWNVIVLDIDVRFEEKSNGEPKCINSNIFKTLIK